MESYRDQIKIVLAVEIAILFTVGGFAYFFWGSVCDESWQSCVGSGIGAPLWFLLFSIIRPFLATPTMVMALMAGEAFGTFWGTLLNSLGATISCLIVFLPAKYLGKIYLEPWIATNLPAFWRLIRTQDWKLVFFTRFIPIFPFDIFSILYGVADFRIKSVLVATFFGSLLESFMFTRIAGNPSTDLLTSTTTFLLLLALAIIPLIIIYEISCRRQGQSLWMRIKGVYQELVIH